MSSIWCNFLMRKEIGKLSSRVSLCVKLIFPNFKALCDIPFPSHAATVLVDQGPRLIACRITRQWL